MGIENLSLLNLVKLVQDQKGMRNSCIEYEKFLRLKMLMQNDLKPETEMFEYKFLIELLAYNQVVGKYEKNLDLSTIKDEQTKDKERKVQLLKEVMESINKPTEEGFQLTNQLLIGRFADYLATNLRAQDKIYFLNTAARAYLKVVSTILKKPKPGYEVNHHFDVCTLLKRVVVLYADLAYAIPPNSKIKQPDLKYHLKLIKVRLTKFWRVSTEQREEFVSQDLIDYLFDLFASELNENHRQELRKNPRADALLEIVCFCEDYLNKKYTELHLQLEQVAVDLIDNIEPKMTLQDQDFTLVCAASCNHKIMRFKQLLRQYREPAFRKSGKLTLISVDDVPLKNILLLYRGFLEPIKEIDQREDYDLMNWTILCIYAEKVLNNRLLEIEDKDVLKEFFADKRKLFTEEAKRREGKICSFNTSVVSNDELEAEYHRNIKGHETAGLSIILSWLSYYLLEILNDISEVFRRTNLIFRQLDECHFKLGIIEINTSNSEEEDVDDEDRLVYGTVKLDYLTVLKQLTRRDLAVIEHKVDWLLKRMKEDGHKISLEEISQGVNASNFVPQDHKKIVASLIHKSFLDQTPYEWLSLARSIIPEIENCLRYWLPKTIDTRLNNLLKQASSEVAVLGRENIHYLQLLLGNKSSKEEDLFNLRNSLQHGSVNDLEAEQNRALYKFICRLFFRMVWEFVPLK